MTNIKNCSKHRLIILLALFLLIVIFGCSEEVTGPEGSWPVIDSIIAEPYATNPGGELTVTAYASDPEGDPLNYTWSTFPRAATFSDSTSPICTLYVNQILSGGMKLMVALEVSDGSSRTVDSIWIPLLDGEIITGHVYFEGTKIPIPGAVVTIGRLIDTSNALGEYKIEHVQIGQHELLARKSECGESAITVDVNGGMNQDIRLTCPELTGSMSGSVSTYEGIELENIEVILLNVDGSESDLIGITNVSGNFNITNIPLGNRRYILRSLANAVHSVLIDTFEVNIENSTTVDVEGRIKRLLFSSSGFDFFTDWDIEDTAAWWDPWNIDLINEGMSYNSCEISGLGRLGMSVRATVPADAAGMAVDFTATVNQVVFDINFNVDDDLLHAVDLSHLSGEQSIEIFVNHGEMAAGREFWVEFFAFESDPNICGTVLMTECSIFYFR
jgi:hypothetical protein